MQHKERGTSLMSTKIQHNWCSNKKTDRTDFLKPYSLREKERSTKFPFRVQCGQKANNFLSGPVQNSLDLVLGYFRTHIPTNNFSICIFPTATNVNRYQQNTFYSFPLLWTNFANTLCSYITNQKQYLSKLPKNHEPPFPVSITEIFQIGRKPSDISMIWPTCNRGCN